MKIERFIREYASYTKKALEHNELMNPGIRAELIRRIDGTIKMREYGWISVDEAVRMIAGNPGEDMSAYMV